MKNNKNKTDIFTYHQPRLRKESILLRTTEYFLGIIIFTLLLFLVVMIIYQQKKLEEEMESKCKAITASVSHVAATAIPSEDSTSVVEHCISLLAQEPSIRYVVITPKDEKSFIFTAKRWRMEALTGIWTPRVLRKDKDKDKAGFIQSSLVGEKVFHYTSTFSYSGIDWGWIHIGLSLNEYYDALRAVYLRTIWLAIITILFGLWLSSYFAKRLSLPILKLNEFVQRVKKEGDLSVKVDLKSGDEVENLANSFNEMTEALENSRQELLASKEFTSNIIKFMTDSLIVTDPALKIKMVNQATLDLLLYDEAELIEMPIEMLFGKRFSLLNKEASFEKMLRDGELRDYETYYRKKDNNLVPVSFSSSLIKNKNGDIVYIVSSARDITERKRAENALLESEARLLAAQNSAHIGDWDWDVVRNGMRWSIETYRILGIDRQNIAPSYQLFLDRIDPNDQEFVKKSFEDTFFNKKPSDIDFRIIRPDEMVRFVNVKAEAAFDEKNKPVRMAGTIQDITERKRTEERLRESEEHYRRLVDLSPDAVYILQEGKIISASTVGIKLLGASREEELIGRPILDIVHPDDRDAIWKRLRKAATDGVNAPATHEKFIRFDGKIIDVEELSGPFAYRGKPYIQMVIRDITERKKTEEKIEQAAQEWKITFDSIEDLISILDSNLKIIKVNKAFSDAFKMNPQDIIGKPCCELFEKNKSSLLYNTCQKILEDKTRSVNEFFEPALGLYLEVSCSPVMNEKGEVVNIIHIAKDISQRKQIEKQQRLTQLGKLVADMAHEVNNPLMIISGNAQLSLMSNTESDEVRNKLKIIFEECQKAKNIIHRLLIFSRPSKKEIMPADINQSIESILNIVEHQFHLANIEIKRVYSQNLPLIMIDEQQMHEVFINLLNNSREAMKQPKGGIIEIFTSLKDNFLKIDFKDNGCGMDREILDKIFEPFFTTRDKGTGLGLSVCYGIIKDHNGELKIESEPGKGTTATILLPLRENK